ncbi:plasmid stabilization system protein [Candidatus Thiomargarita nelsonii]|uniref:Plasmid stabilization system protein n=1 Tax=Candidatus Thiomargarita nelsonii TaxID=1003181 RepID=A0A176S3W2_9GAMM|nr:plasmid stabilization system protein [Candidatus Thiomargarita nelsonii]
MEIDAFAVHLSTHKLGGELYGLYACSCGYDCRIVFSIEKYQETGEEVIVLLNIGTHDDVY